MGSKNFYIASDNKQLKAVAKIFFNIFFLTLLQTSSFGQSTLTGKITDSKNKSALAGASVYIPDIKIGAISKADGSYEIKNIERGTYLIEVSYVGYAPQYKEINFKGGEIADFSLDQSSVESPEVVVTGVTSATEQRSNPVPVSFVTRNSLLEISSNNIIDALSYAPGVYQITM